MKVTVEFHFESITAINIPKGFIPWLNNFAEQINKPITLNYVFCSDDFLLSINKQYLSHNYYTDIITFDLSDDDMVIEGDLFISLDRVLDNSKKENSSFDAELIRVMCHGVFHLVGQDDKTTHDVLIMRKLEDKAISEIL